MIATLMLRRILSFFSLTLFLGLILGVAVNAQNLSMYERKIRFENSIVDQIYNHLDGMIDRKFYKVTANVELERGQLPLSRQVYQSGLGDSSRKNKTGNENLPGFEAGDATSQIRRETSTTYEDVDQLKALAIQLFIDNKMPDDQAKAAETYIREHWIDTDPEKCTLIVTKTDLPTMTPDAQPAPVASGSEAGDDKKNSALNWRDWPTWVPLAVLLSLFVGLLLLRPKSKPGNIDVQMNSQKPETLDRQPVALTGDQPLTELKEAFVHELVADPQAARGFLENLGLEGKEDILAYYQHAYTRELLEKWMGYQAETPFGIRDMRPERLAIYLAELREYKDLRRVNMQAPFGYLTGLDEYDLYELIADETKENIASLLPYIPESKRGGVMSYFGQESQEKILSLVAGGEDLLKESGMAKFDARLRERFEHILKNQLPDRQAPEMVVRSVLDASPQSVNLAKKLIEDNPETEVSYGKYKLTLDDLLAMDADRTRRALSTLDNETIIKALSTIEEKSRDKLMAAMSTERSRIIKGLSKSLGTKFSADETKEASRILQRTLRNID